MKKTNILAIGVLAGALVILSGCKDSFLEQEPPKSAPVEEYFSTIEHIDEAMNAAYVPARMYDYDGNNFAALNWIDMLGDDMLVGAAGPSDQEVWHNASDYRLTADLTITNYWDESYAGIRMCNEVIDYIENNKEALAAESANYVDEKESEARVLRAFYYSVVWKNFGNIPYFTQKLNAEDKPEQVTADEAYQAIITDLEDVIALNALPIKQDEDNLGRASKALAYMIYADLVLYQNDEARFSKALSFMTELINGADYDLDLAGYAHLFSSDGEWGPESIFEINYTDGSACVRGYDNLSGIGGSFQGKCLAPEGGDAAASVIDGWGTFIVRKTTYDQYSPNDERRDVSCFVPSGNYTARYQDQGVFCGKYIARTPAEGTGGADHCQSNQNLRVYRYAETLLNAAELLVRTGGSAATAKNYITQVRQRAGLVSEVEPTLDNILQERRLEFLGEGKRYYDLVRMEGVSGVTTKASTVLKIDTEAINGKGERGRQANWSANKKYLPISSKEISAAEGALRQNDAYFN
ncbi:MAG: RagB/SusD family nutrient uptake outer membrane protein [Prevotella sp.]|nr:RagB/SusD family nutrient uptake outer membrane protein [Prevotella sp.]